MTMNMTVSKMYESADRTISLLSIDNEPFGFCLEDGFHEVKIPGETRIPAGTYELVKRTQGGFYEKYRANFGHKFSIHVKDVPGFEQILMHIGNYPKDTRGCLLVGYDIIIDDSKLFINRSTSAYKALYQQVERAFERGEKVTITITR